MMTRQITSFEPGTMVTLLREAVATRWRAIIVVFLLTTVAATVAVYIRLPSYESSAAVLINVERFNVSSSRADMRQDVAVLTTVEAVTSQAEVLRSRDLVERLVDRLDAKVFDRPPSPYALVRLVSRVVDRVGDEVGDALRAVRLLPPRNPRFNLIRRIEGGLDI